MIRSCGIGKARLTLYHGTPYSFTQFKDRTTHFSDTFDFACRYAREKSQDAEMDADITVFECEFEGRLFDINYASCERLLKDLLPEKVYVRSSMFYGMFGKEYPRDLVIQLMKGRATVYPEESFLKAKTGDRVPKPEYAQENLMVLKKTRDYIYLFDEKRFYDILDAITRGYHRYHSDYDYQKEFGNVGKEYVDYIESIRVREREKLPLFGGMPPFPDFLNPEERLKAQEMKKSAEERLKVEILEKGDRVFLKKIPLKAISEDLDDTWTFFENDSVLPAIKGLGFDGYVAKERKENTYAIFSPSKTITIIKDERC